MGGCACGVVVVAPGWALGVTAGCTAIVFPLDGAQPILLKLLN